MSGQKRIHSDGAPDAVGPYSQAIRSGDTFYLSGQIGLEPDTGEMVSENVQDQTEQVLENLIAVLEQAGASLEDVVKTTVYLTDMNDYESFNNVYGQYFQDVQPARACVEVCSLPKGALVEVELVAEI